MRKWLAIGLVFLSSCGKKPLLLYAPDENGFCRLKGNKISCIKYQLNNKFLCARSEEVQAFGFSCRNREPLPQINLCFVQNKKIICDEQEYQTPNFDFLCLRDATARQWLESCREVQR